MRARLLIQEGVRYYKRNRLLTMCGTWTLVFGMGTSSVALSVLWSLSHSRLQGLQPGGYATIAELFPGSRLQPISWRTAKGIEAAMRETFVGAYGIPGSVAASSGSRSINLRLAAASVNFFEQFTEPLAAGSVFFRADEDLASVEAPIILSFKMATELFGSPSQAIGNSLLANGVTLHVVGVSSKSFEGLFQSSVDGWVPPPLALLGLYPGGIASGDTWKNVAAFYAIAGNRHAVNREVASAAVRALRKAPNLRTLEAVSGLNIDPVRMSQLKTWSGLAVFVAVVLTLSSGFSLGGQLFAQAPRLLEEMRLKRILGASTLRLCKDLLAGPLCIVGCALFCAMVLTVSTMIVLERRLEILAPWIAWPARNAMLTLAAQFPLVLAIVTGAALVPALRLLRDTGAPQLTYSGTTKQSTRLLEGIAVAQIVICICASVVAVTVARSVTHLSQQTLGYETQNRTVLIVGAKKSGIISYMTDSRGGTVLQFAFRRVRDRLSALAGVKGVAVAQGAPLDAATNSMLLSEFKISPDQRLSIGCNGITANYFKELGTPLTEGRQFANALWAGDPVESVVNETLRRQLWPHQSPIGKVLRLEHPFGTIYTVSIVGVVADQRIGGPKESVSPMVFLPLSGNVFQNLPRHLIVNGNVPAFRLEAVANEELSSAFPGLEVVRSYRIDEALRSLLFDEQARVVFAMTASAGISIIALIGLYSSLTYFINGKSHALAIRICYGATPNMIFGMLMAQAVRMGIASMLIAWASFGPLRYFLSSGWIGSSSWFTPAAIAASLLCFGILLTISILPAYRASRFEAKGLTKMLTRM